MNFYLQFTPPPLRLPGFTSVGFLLSPIGVDAIWASAFMILMIREIQVIGNEFFSINRRSPSLIPQQRPHTEGRAARPGGALPLGIRAR